MGNKCTKESYLRTFSKCASVLRSDISHEEIINQLREEFDQDCQEKKKKKKKRENDDDDDEHETEQRKEEESVVPGMPLEELDEEKLKYAIFELADVWCPAIDAQEYSDFLSHLSIKVRYKIGGTGDDPYSVI